MKPFTEPTGKFLLEIPNHWQYKNPAVGLEDTSPFDFEFYEGSIGAFQISCYSEQEIPLNKYIPIQKSDTSNLEFLNARMDDKESNIHLWYAIVEDHLFMAKYIYDAIQENDPRIITELEKVEKALSSLILISSEKREIAVENDKYEKFIASLSASFDLKNKAVKNESYIELIIIIANQIDAYLRIAIVFKKSLQQESGHIDISFLYQGENDSPIMERKIYKIAKDFNIIDQDTFNDLEKLYNARNKVVHRYIITDFKTRDLFKIVDDYDKISVKVRQALEVIEELYFNESSHNSIDKLNPLNDPSQGEPDIQRLYSFINDKHLIKELYREINP